MGPPYFQTSKIKTSDHIPLQTIFVKDVSSQVTEPDNTVRGLCVPYPSDYIKNKNSFCGIQTFAVLPKNFYSSLDAWDGLTIPEFEKLPQKYSESTITYPCVYQASEGLSFRLLDNVLYESQELILATETNCCFNFNYNPVPVINAGKRYDPAFCSMGTKI